MIKNQFYKDVLKALVLFCVILGLCRVTIGVVAILVAVAGSYFALQRKSGYLVACYILFPIFTIFNRSIVGVSPIFLMMARIGNLIMILAMMLTGQVLLGVCANGCLSHGCLPIALWPLSHQLMDGCRLLVI